MEQWRSGNYQSVTFLQRPVRHGVCSAVTHFARAIFSRSSLGSRSNYLSLNAVGLALGRTWLVVEEENTMEIGFGLYSGALYKQKTCSAVIVSIDFFEERLMLMNTT